jgi:exodeoxyribonuclease VII large subunit
MQIESKVKIFTVYELTVGIKNLLESNFRYLSIRGEISNFKKLSSGHFYFNLKDESSQIFCAMFKNSNQGLTRIPKDGDEVILQAQISVYPPRGNYQLIVRNLSYVKDGELLLRLQALKEKLKNKGYFEEKYKKPIPLFPKTIGIITSPTGSVIQDIIKVLKRRFSTLHLILNPVKVQGAGSAIEIAKAIKDFNKYNLADVLIVGRGGGSLEDLFSFNEEIVAQAVFESKIPIISAIGHETDTTICDFVADVRAPTPSAAAEIVIKEKNSFLENLQSIEYQLRKMLLHKINLIKVILEKFESQSIFSSSNILLAKNYQMLDDLKSSLDNLIRQKLKNKFEILNIFTNQLKTPDPSYRLLKIKQDFQVISQRILLSQKKIIVDKKTDLEKLKNHLNSLDPKNLLKKGYSILFSEKDSSIILSKDSIEKGEKFIAMILDGKLIAKLEDKK